MNNIQIETLFLALGLGFSSCISTRDTVKINKVEIGMTKDEVRNLLGKPLFKNADETGETGEETAGQECERNPRVLDTESISQDSENGCQDKENDDDDLILLLQVCHRSLANILGNFFHCRSALTFFLHLAIE